MELKVLYSLRNFVIIGLSSRKCRLDKVICSVVACGGMENGEEVIRGCWRLDGGQDVLTVTRGHKEVSLRAESTHF